MKYRLSSPKMTVRVEADENGIITWAAPVVRKFKGQPLENLERWMGTKAEAYGTENQQTQ